HGAVAVGMALGLLVPAAGSRADEAAAVRAVRKLGGRVTVDPKRPGKPVVRVDLVYTRVTDSGLQALQGLTGLQELDLGYTRVTDAGLQALKGLTGLQRLFLIDTQVTEAGVKGLQAALPKLLIQR